MSSTFFNRGVRHAGFLTIAVVSAAVLAACSTYDSVTHKVVDRLTPYHLTIEQGNFVSNETAQKLQKGMSRDQVKALLGTPLLTDMFHQERWDYVFSFRRGPVEIVQQRDLVLIFNGDSLDHWTGADDLPSEQELIAAIDGDNKESNLLRQERLAKNAAAASEAAAASSAAASAPVAANANASSSGVAPNVAAANAANAATSFDTTPRGQKPVPNGSQIPQPIIGGVQQPTGQPQINLQRSAPVLQQNNAAVPDSSGLDRVLNASDAAVSGAPAPTPSPAPPQSGSSN